MRFVLAVGLALLVACGSPSDLPHVNTTQIVATDNQFGPQVDTVAANQNIFWSFPSTNGNAHNVTWASGPGTPPAPSGTRNPGDDTYTVFFATPGTYTYFCGFHGASDGSGMSGTLVVQ